MTNQTSTDVAGILAPYMSPPSRPDDLPSLHDIDQRAARKLLDLLPEKYLAERHTSYGPTTADILTTVMNHLSLVR